MNDGKMIYLSTNVFGTQTPAEDERGKPPIDLEPPDKRKHTSGGGEDNVKAGLLARCLWMRWWRGAGWK